MEWECNECGYIFKGLWSDCPEKCPECDNNVWIFVEGSKDLEFDDEDF